MNIKNLRRARHSMTPGIDHLESRQMLTGIVPSFSIVPSPTITRSGLNAVARISDNDIWAVGNTQPFNTGDVVTLAEHFNGTSWTSVPIPNPAGGFGGVLKGVAAVASNNVWAVGNSVSVNSLGESVASTLIEHFNGTSWSIVPSPNPTGGGVLTAVTAISANNIWAVGHIGIGRGGNLIEHFDGTSWSIVASPQGPDTFLNSVSGTSANDVWAVGSIGRGDSIQILHFNGTSWSAVSGLPADSVLNSVVAIAPNNVWAVGADIEHFDGTSWSIVPSPGVGSELGSIAAFSANDIYAVGGGIEHWDGTSWSIVSAQVPPNTGGASFSGVTTLSTGDAIAVGLAQPLTGPNNYNAVIEQN